MYIANKWFQYTRMFLQSTETDKGLYNENCLEENGECCEGVSSDDEIWSEISEQQLDQDVASSEPLPDPEPKRRKIQVTNSILQWLLYIILIWQGVCHVSDNGLAWLLRFILQFLKVLNIHVTGELVTELIAIFPTSLYMVRQFLALDRDNFTKYIVCPKCTMCYEYSECVRHVNGRDVVKRCSNKSYLR